MPSIRRALPVDAAPLAAFAERTFRATFGPFNTPSDMDLVCAASYGESLQARELADPGLTTLLAESDGVLAAYVQLRHESDLADGLGDHAVARTAEIVRLYVDTPWHGHGIAQQLMTDAIALATHSGARRIALGVWEHNPRAIAFYEKCGFVEVGAHQFMLGTDAQRDVVMARDLPANA